ncbi:hypothetical protein K227x_64990 [Rubripirellula lacrimiformis]|uniref:Segregation and condensation protein B n=1 Tax=Rubripirellula lacrimiformis TaxID=1930273 RepID=A0A517NLV7_9BACT|nr:SMC-Scp complex subunit ScpB [Rubripirellula lacrimiformis]QDT08069.1 hypothetical protein K227x_64990 [Rubripirellula lacrimiformis]
MQRLWSPADHRVSQWGGRSWLAQAQSASGLGTQGAGNQVSSVQTSVATASQTHRRGLRRPYSVSLAVIGDHATEDLAGDAAGEEDDEDPRVRRMRVEGVLLISKTPLSPRKLAQLAHLADATEARTLVRQLNRVYDTLGRAIRVEQVAGGFRMLTHPTLAPWLARLGHLPPATRLSTPMMETLAVVAYRQPVSRASAEAIRGVACGELLRQLMERDLIRIAGRSEELGRPYLYGTTKRFLQLFGLANTDALPPIDWQTLNDDAQPDLPLDDLSTSTKEPVVSASVAPVLGQAADFAVTPIADANPLGLAAAAAQAIGDAPVAIIEDDEDEIEIDVDDDDDEDWDDDDDDDDDWDDDDDDDEEDDDELEDDWEEVDDDDDDDDDDEDDDEEDDSADDDEEEDDDEDWSEDDDADDSADDAEEDEEEWD